MIKNKKIIVFDFDGVVCDSTDECMVTSWNAWEEWEARDNFRNDLSEFTENDKLNFRKVRPRVRGAGEYYILRRAFSEGISIDNQEVYDKLEDRWQENIEPFKAIFFKAREKLRRDDINAWIDLHPVFNGVVEVMKILNDQNRLYIATLKDAKSVRLILENKDIKIKENRLLDQSQIKSKLQALDKFRKQIACNKKDMVFIDDNVTHLLEPNNEKYTVFLTTWGVVLDEYLSIAKIHNIQLLDNCIKLLNYE
jgi:phosphoglycolate phosphatase-like HAD superfamily hydrolase